MKVYEHVNLRKPIGSFFTANWTLNMHPKKSRLVLFSQYYGSWKEMKPYYPEESIETPIQALNCMKQLEDIIEGLDTLE